MDRKLRQNLINVVANRLGVAALMEVDEAIVLGAWYKRSYKEIAIGSGYSPVYVKQRGAQICKQLSQELGGDVTKDNLKQVLHQLLQQTLSLHQLEGEIRCDWGRAPEIPELRGRDTELELLQNWVVGDRCRLVTLWGGGGMGKTALSVKLARRTLPHFNSIVWRSLVNRPPLQELLPDIVSAISGKPELDIHRHPATAIDACLRLMQERRCLLILDNAESLLDSGNEEDRQGYSDYSWFWEALATVPHQSCTIVSTRERIPQLTIHEQVFCLDTPEIQLNSATRTLKLTGLGVSAARELFADCGCEGTDSTAWQEVFNFFAGNPFGLKIAASTIAELGGDIAALAPYLQLGKSPIEDIEELLKLQWERISKVERQVLYWLAVAREPMSLEELSADFINDEASNNNHSGLSDWLQEIFGPLLTALQSLGRRSIVERQKGVWGLQPVVLEFVSQMLVRKVGDELLGEDIDILWSNAICKAQSKEYVRQIQQRTIVSPLRRRLLEDSQEIDSLAREILAKLRGDSRYATGYAAGNLLNLLNSNQGDLSQLDCRGLAVWQAYLADCELQGGDFRDVDFQQCSFAQPFGIIASLAYSPDGSTIAAGTAAGDVHLWRDSDGQQLMVEKGHTNWVRGVAFSPDGRYLASASEDLTMRIWDLEDNRCVAVMTGHTDKLHEVKFSPDGSYLASASEDGTIRLWEAGTWQCRRVLTGHDGWVIGLAFHPEGKWLASAGLDRSIRIWHLQTGSCLQELTGHEDWVVTVAVSPDGEMIASGSWDRTVRLWKAATGEAIGVLTGHENWVWTVAFSADSQYLASGGEDRKVRVWTVADGKLRHCFGPSGGRIWSVAFDPTGDCLTSAGEDYTISKWNMDEGRCVNTIRGYTDWCRTIVFSTDDKEVIGGGKEVYLRWWDIASGQTIIKQRGHTKSILSVAKLATGDGYISGSEDGTVRLWFAKERGERSQFLYSHAAAVWGVAVASNGHTIASGSLDGTVRIWNTVLGKSLRELPGHDDPNGAIAFCPDTSILAVAGKDRHLALWDVVTGETIDRGIGHDDRIKTVVFSPDGRWVITGSIDGIIKCWDWRTGECQRTYSEHRGIVFCLAVSPDGKLLASGSDDRLVRLWNLATGELLHTFQQNANWVRSVAFSDDDRYLASADDAANIIIWDRTTFATVNTLVPALPYSGTNLANARGLTVPQRLALITLGAIDT